jgi:hypothetical protein
MFLGVISGMVFVYSLDLLTTRLPATLHHDFQHWKILRYHLVAQIDNLTVIDKKGKKVPLRNQYAEEMDLNCYFYHAIQTGRRLVMMELVPKKIVPKSITVAGRDETRQRGPKFAARAPAPWYLFLDFADDGAIECQRRTAGIRDMIVSTYCVRRLPKGKIFTRDTWSGEVDMGPFITTYRWRFDDLKSPEPRKKRAYINGEGDFFEELSAAGRGEKLGSFTYSYTLGVGRAEGYIRKAEGSFDLRSRKSGTGISYREEFVQKLVEVKRIPPAAQNTIRQQLEELKEIFEQEKLGDYQAFHDGLFVYLRRFPGSPFWNNLLILLNDLRTKCGEKPATEEDIFGKPKQGKK